VDERWKEHFEHDIAFHRKTAAIYDHVNTEPRLLANDLLFAPLDRRVATGESMLDLGCGTGQMLLRYASRFRLRCRRRSQSRNARPRRSRMRATALSDRCTLVHSDFFGYLERESARHSFVTCVGCLHHLPVEAFDVFFKLVKSRLRPDGQLLLAEPVDTQGRQAPSAVAKWNARSVMAARAPLMPMEESHEAPIGADVLLRQPEGFGFRRVVASRAWEMFQRSMPANALDHLAMRYLAARYGDTGNVVAALWQAA
jgi:SAM-dependent methyltransferase